LRLFQRRTGHRQEHRLLDLESLVLDERDELVGRAPQIDMALGVARMIGITLTRVIARFLFTPLSIAGTRYAARKRWRGPPRRRSRSGCR
jgi:hypothetical protein